ncbi:MAG: c-type cytochrome, partial [Chloroflexota bacterium]
MREHPSPPPRSHVCGERGEIRPVLTCLAILLVCTALLAGCGGLAGEPRIVATLPPATPLPTAAPYPADYPDVALGAQIFAANCTRCHGADGKGNGELVQSGQVAKAADFTDPATSADQRPSDFYATITDGKIESLMPPWADALSDDERWAVALYSYTLLFTQEQIARGRDLCAACDLADASSLSASELDAQLAALPALASLSDQDRRAAAAYVRSQSVTNPDAIGV